jgi:hypothetical protein
VSDHTLTAASAIAGDLLSPSRIQAQRVWFEFLHRHLYELRKFDAGGDDPLPLVRL